MLDHAHAPARLAAQEVGRAQDPIVGGQIRVDLAPVIGVVAQRDRIDARREHLVGDLRGDPQAARRVLAVDDHERGRVALAQDRQAVEQRVPADAADDVADEQDDRGACAGPGAHLVAACRGGGHARGGRLGLSHTLAMVGGR